VDDLAGVLLAVHAVRVEPSLAGRPVHVVAAYEPPETIYVVTCYHPEAEQWDASYRRRR